MLAKQSEDIKKVERKQDAERNMKNVGVSLCQKRLGNYGISPDMVGQNLALRVTE